MPIDSDLFIVVGVLLAAFALPSSFGAYSERQFPLVSLIVLGLGLGLIAVAILTGGGGYAPSRIPQAFIEILARIFN